MRALALIVLVALAAASRADGGWLLGMWALDAGSRATVRDTLEFLPDGRVRLDDADGRRLAGGYRLQGERLHLFFEVNGRLLPLVMTYGPARDRLHLLSAPGGVEAVYRKATPAPQ